MDGMKYDKVVEMNQKIGKQNARIVEKEIERMIENGERVTVAALQRYTGFSNSFFYKNKLVREILYEAIRKQNQCYKNNLTSMCTQQEIEEKMIKQQKQILQLELEKRKLLEENQRRKEKMKYDKIVAISQEKSKVKAEIAKQEIQNMLDRKEKVTMAALIRKTGFSKTLFYRNIEVRTALDKAYREQGACYNPKQIIVDKVMEEKLNTLKIAVTKLKKENIKLTLQNEELLKEIERLKLQLEKK